MGKFDSDLKFSFIVPVHDVPQEVFKRCLLSIADQDYPNIEVIIVPNGGDKKAEAMAREFVEGEARNSLGQFASTKNWRVEPIDEKGACNARNHGFSLSTGDIVSFFNSDYQAKIGMVSVWVDALKANPDCGFVYGAYEYKAQERDVYPSKKFDVYQLEVANYIDCGFPLWRKHVVKWDPEVKSLQDWDFWLSVVKNGVKGHFLGLEVSFIAEYPRQKGLSHDSSENWNERVKFIKDKHGIPTRDICVTSIGAPFHGLEIAKMIEADYRDDTLHKPTDVYKALYLIGWYMKPGEARNGHSHILSRFPNSRKIIHFVGADIYWLRKFPVEQIRSFAGAIKLACHHVLSENEAAQAELRSYGIDSEVVPIPPYTNLQVTPLPKEFSVAVYLTDKSDFDKYLQEHTLSIVKAMPDVKFYGYGDASLDGFKSKNFEHKGNMTTEEWGRFVYANSAYLRLVKHDTRPMASDEFIIAGRSVITNIPAPHMDVIDTSGELTIDAWDRFNPGFSGYRWPETKAKIVEKIREVKKRQTKQESEFMGQAIVASSQYRQILDKQKFIETIRRLAQPAPVKLEVANV